jgi:hypothetical protein
MDRSARCEHPYACSHPRRLELSPSRAMLDGVQVFSSESWGGSAGAAVIMMEAAACTAAADLMWNGLSTVDAVRI